MDQGLGLNTGVSCYSVWRLGLFSGMFLGASQSSRGSGLKGICFLPEGAVRSVIDLSLPEVSGLETETQKIESFLEKDKEDGGSATEVWPELIADALPQLRGDSLLQMLSY